MKAKIIEPGIYPKRLPADIPASEAAVYGMLAEALPDGWSAWHSLKIRTQKGDYAEADFVVADPEKGVVLFEVKGGLIEKRDGQWFQNGKPLRPPLQQVHHFRRCLLDVFEGHRLSAPPVGVAIIFPDMYASDIPTQGDLLGVVIQGRELQYLKEIFLELIRTALPKNVPYPASSGWPQFVHDLWCECWPLEMNLSRKVRQDMKTRLRLDESQVTVLGSLPANRRALVKGAAGTGKTLIALNLAIDQAVSGKSVLFLTFTEALASELAKQAEGTGVHVRPVGRMALAYLRKRGLKKEEEYSPEFWTMVMKKAAAPKRFGKPEKWDLIIVDEGQDMGEEEWRFSAKYLDSQSRLWVFLDPDQAFWDDKALPAEFREEAAVFILPRPYRCPPGIQALADAYLGKPFDPEAVAASFNDRTISIIPVPRSEHVHPAVAHEISRLVAEGFSPDEVAVISLRGIQFENNIAHCQMLGEHEVVKATDPRAAESIVCDSFLRFKGLERPAVIVTDLEYVPDKYGVRMNIAVTRSLGVLRIVGEQEQLNADDLLSRLVMAGPGDRA